MKKID